VRTVFFDSADGTLDLGGSPYVSADAHLADELALADLRLGRARAHLAHEPVTELDTQISTRRAWIDQRIGATTEELPVLAVVRKLALVPWEVDAMMVLA